MIFIFTNGRLIKSAENHLNSATNWVTIGSRCSLSPVHNDMYGLELNLSEADVWDTWLGCRDHSSVTMCTTTIMMIFKTKLKHFYQYVGALYEFYIAHYCIYFHRKTGIANYSMFARNKCVTLRYKGILR